jgi:tetratricopeptide (TPR) repeat protein
MAAFVARPSREALMKRIFISSFLFAILCAIFALPAAAQTATVKGVCKDPQGNPITDAQVVWHNNDNGRTFNLKTNKKGEYFSLGIEPGKYTVTLTKDGKELDKVNNFPVSSDEMTLDFDIKKSQEQAVQETAKQHGMTPEQVKQAQEQAANAEKYNSNIKAINEKFNAANAALKATPPQYDAAIASLNEATQLGPNEDLVWFRLGAAYLDSAKTATDPADKTKRYTEAYNDIQKAVDLKKAAMSSAPQGAAPAKPPAPGGVSDQSRMAAYYDNLAAAAAKIGKSDDAVKAYQQAAELDPTHAGQYYYNLGAVLTNSNMSNDVNVRKQAIEAFDKAIVADPNRADAYFWKGQNYMGMATTDNSGKIQVPEGTAESYQKYLELQPTGPHAEEAKQMLAALNANVETSYGKKSKSKDTKK